MDDSQKEGGNFLNLLQKEEVPREGGCSLRKGEGVLSLEETMAQYLEMTMNLKANNQTIKFGQLMGCNMRKTFLEKSYTKCGGETSLRPFPEKSNVKLF